MFCDTIIPNYFFLSSAFICFPARVSSMLPPFVIILLRAFLSPISIRPVLSSFTFTLFSFRLLNSGFRVRSNFLSHFLKAKVQFHVLTISFMCTFSLSMKIFATIYPEIQFTEGRETLLVLLGLGVLELLGLQRTLGMLH